MMFSAFGDKKAIKGRLPFLPPDPSFPIAPLLTPYASCLDPYYGGNNGFDKSFEQCTEYSRQILDHVASEEKK
jgi:hypothetical protein